MFIVVYSLMCVFWGGCLSSFFFIQILAIFSVNTHIMSSTQIDTPFFYMAVIY